MTRRFCLTLKLKTTPALVVNAVVTANKSARTLPGACDSGIEEMQIYIRGTRMFMIMHVNETFPWKPSCETSSRPYPTLSLEKSGCPWNALST